MLDNALQQGGTTEQTGTIVTFYPDPEIFETTYFDFETLRARFQQMAFLNKGLTITLTDERGNGGSEELAGQDGEAEPETPEAGEAETTRKISYRYDGGLIDYVQHLVKARKLDVIHPEIIAFESEDPEEEISLEVAMQWTSAYTEGVHTYANTINTSEGGTHEEGFRSALTTLINRYARERGILRERDDNLTGDDVREGLTAVISIKLGEPQFEGQTKTKLGNTEARTFTQKVVFDQLGEIGRAHV